jgi:nicotinic acid mononucleotide adenylyltransferase
MAGKSDKNTHLEHLEDDIINLGYKGAQQSIAFVEALFELFQGKSNRKMNITVKWDGAPAVVCGKDPETGLFFVATKHGAFAKDPKLGFTPELIDFYYSSGPGETLKHVYHALKDSNMQDVLQGDVMFTPDIKKNTNIDGKNYITFKPNTIMYAVPPDDPLGEKIGNATVGIVFHTKYSGKRAVNQMSASFSVDVSKLKSKTAWIQDASYQDMSGKMTMTAQETRTVSSHIASAKTNAISARKFLDELATQQIDLTVGYMFKIFVNRLVRDGTPINERSLAGLESFVIDRVAKKEVGMKTAAGQQKYAGLKKELQKYIRDNNVNFRSMFKVYTSLLDAKNIFVKKLNEAQGIPTFIETPEGFRATDPEGYVAIDKTGNAVKLVNRMEFSQANFNAVKDWSKTPVGPTELETEVKTLVFSWGRLNPPTIGHKKLVDKVLSVAKAKKAEHVVLLTRTQKAPKDPLSPDDKLMFAEKMFPNANVDIATRELSTIFAWLKHWNGQYDKLVLICGSDRVGEFEKLLQSYNGKDYTYKAIEIISAGERDPDSEGVTGMSASKLRGYAQAEDYKNFRKGLPSTFSEADSKALYQAVIEGMN